MVTHRHGSEGTAWGGTSTPGGCGPAGSPAPAPHGPEGSCGHQGSPDPVPSKGRKGQDSQQEERRRRRQ